MTALETNLLNTETPPFFAANPSTLEMRVHKLLALLNTCGEWESHRHLAALFREIQIKIAELSTKIAHPVEMEREQIAIFEEQSPTQSAKMGDYTRQRRVQMREEMIERREGLLLLSIELSKWL
jgi:hypothetical protein